MITPLRLYLSESLFVQNLKYQVLSVELTSSDRLIEPQDIKNLELPSGIDPTGGVVISGPHPCGFILTSLMPYIQLLGWLAMTLAWEQLYPQQTHVKSALVK
ncbi:CRISPR-associated protein Csx3 [Nostoc sp. TCL240-02]|uniref:CRISPR-associated protein Csx3 n=1 Tax=Nostoc sp. TCL240-02 TaxID=2572090 RepID=UPI0020C6C800|nr:CRISPR-associated protein Csx3 [Nostoc sp. TCL240-02]